MTQTGRYVIVEINGRLIECTTIGGLAAAMRRTPHCIRCWERSGLIPPAPVMLTAADWRGARRLYPLVLVDALSQFALRRRFGRRRAADSFELHREEIRRVWKSALSSVPERAVVHYRDSGE